MKYLWTAAACVVASLALAGPALAGLRPDPGPATAAAGGTGLRPDSFASATRPAPAATPSTPSTAATIRPADYATPEVVPEIQAPRVVVVPTRKTAPSVSDTAPPVRQTAPPVSMPVVTETTPPKAVESAATAPVDQPSASPPDAAPARSESSSAEIAKTAKSNAARTRETNKQRVAIPPLPVDLVALPFLSGSLRFPPVPTVDEANRFLLPAALALLTLVAASGGFLSLAYRMARERVRPS